MCIRIYNSRRISGHVSSINECKYHRLRVVLHGWAKNEEGGKKRKYGKRTMKGHLQLYNTYVYMGMHYIHLHICRCAVRSECSTWGPWRADYVYAVHVVDFLRSYIARFINLVNIQIDSLIKSREHCRIESVFCLSLSLSLFSEKIPSKIQQW